MTLQRKFMIGSEWLYYKIYSGPRTVENILVEIYPKIKKLIDDSLIDSFFYIRYQDPDYHLRVRLHLVRTDKTGEVCRVMYHCLNGYVEHFIVHKIELDIYNREIERYGQKNMQNCEHMFYMDSDFILWYLMNTKCGNDERWLVAIGYIYNMTDEAGYSLADKIRFTKKMADEYYSEMYGRDNEPAKKLNKLYRDKRAVITSVFWGCGQYSWWTKQKKYIRLGILTFQGTINEEVLASMIHMHVNRLFRTKQRLVEMVLYYYLHKFLESENGRIKYSLKNK